MERMSFGAVPEWIIVSFEPFFFCQEIENEGRNVSLIGMQEPKRNFYRLDYKEKQEKTSAMGN